MTNHDLKVGVIIDLDIGGCGCAGVLESDRGGGVRADVGEEAAPVPRCLPLGSSIISKRVRRN
jgi:hypothetical protein